MFDVLLPADAVATVRASACAPPLGYLTVYIFHVLDQPHLSFVSFSALQVAPAVPERQGGAGGPTEPGAHSDGKTGAERRADGPQRHQEGNQGRDQQGAHHVSVGGSGVRGRSTAGAGTCPMG